MEIKPLKGFFDNIYDIDKQLIAHSERVAMLSLALGNELELNNSNKERLYFVALFHDIGKFKTPEKFKECYPIISANILRSHETFKKLADIVEQCHENIDGSGYPYNLKSENIHIFATIVRLCDEYDNLRMEGKSHEETMSEIRKKSDVICPKKLLTLFAKVFLSCDLLEIYKDDER